MMGLRSDCADVALAWKRAVFSRDIGAAIAVLALGWLSPRAIAQRSRPPPAASASALLSEPYVARWDQIVPDVVAFAIIVPTTVAIFAGLSFADAAAVRAAAARARVAGAIYALAGTVFVVNVVKRYCGYYRPYFYGACDFDADAGACRDDDDDPYQSFPSGHAADSFVLLLHAAYCLLGRARLGAVVRRVGGVDVGDALALACLAPVFLAAWISASRVRERDHWPADVAAGAAIGSAFATLFYHRHFPPFFDAHSHEPRRIPPEDCERDRPLLAAPDAAGRRGELLAPLHAQRGA